MPRRELDRVSKAVVKDAGRSGLLLTGDVWKGALVQIEWVTGGFS